MNEYEGEVLNECGEPQASVYGVDREDVVANTLHYLMMYSQDGPHTAMIREVGEWEEVTE